MFETISRSWGLTKTSWSVIKKDKEMLWLPILSAIFSTIFILLLLVPTVALDLISDTDKLQPGDLVFLFLAYLIFAFVSTFFNVGVVYIAKTRFEGGDATFGQAISFAFTRIHVIFLWSLVSATVGVILALLDQVAHGDNQAAAVVAWIVKLVVSIAWSIVSMFVIPAMVFYNLSPFAAMRKSTDTFGKTWGENFVRNITMMFIQMFFILIGVVFLILGFYLIGSTPSTAAIAVIIGVFLIYIIIIILIFSCMTQVYNTALFMYAETGKAPSGFTQAHMQEGFKQRVK